MRRRFVLKHSNGDIDVNNYLTIEALEDGLMAALSVNACEYCIDGDGNWKSLSAGTTTKSINAGHTLSFRGNLTPNGSNGIGTFIVNKYFNLKGNVMSMLFGDGGKDNYSLSGKNYAFYNLFNNCNSLKSVSANFLPATTLENYCYGNMFQNCVSLTTAPELPATTLIERCYHCMFRNCSSLTTAPELPATTLASSCYYWMFSTCSSLTTAPELPATTLAPYCYAYMFSSCSKLTTPPELPVTTLDKGCYSGMFEYCSKLTTAPELPATTLASSCYNGMFGSCSKLTTAPALPATILAPYCYYEMFDYCYSLKTAPELPATTLSRECYRFMFRGCSELNYIKMLATDISADYCLDYWVYSVASSGTFVKNPAMTALPTGTSGIPSGWTVVNDGEESGGNLITFTIGNTQYQAEEGMTWGEWVDSEYNTDNFAHDGINFVGNRVCDVSGNQINDDTILHDGDFYSLLNNPEGGY
jgi:hypothetical protein